MPWELGGELLSQSLQWELEEKKKILFLIVRLKGQELCKIQASYVHPHEFSMPGRAASESSKHAAGNAGPSGP